MANLAHSLLLVEINEVDRELHEEGMNGFAGYDPQTLPRLQPLVFEQSDAALGAGIGGVRRVGKHGVAGEIANEDQVVIRGPSAASPLRRRNRRLTTRD